MARRGERSMRPCFGFLLTWPHRLAGAAKSLAFGSLLSLAALSGAYAAECHDVSQGEPSVLEGLLSARVFAGPPNFEDVSKGDQPEPGYLLKLDMPICLTGDEDFTDPDDMFDEVQVVPTEATQARMDDLTGKRVRVELENPMPAHTGHHYRPLVAWVAAIEAR